MNQTPSERIGNALAFGVVLLIILAGAWSVLNVLRGGSSVISFGGTEEVRPTQAVVVLQPTLTPFDAIVLEPTNTPLIFEPPTPAAPTATSAPQLETVLPPTATPSPTDTPPPSPTATETLPPTATAPPTETPTATPIPSPTPVPPSPTPPYPFRIAAAGPDFGRGCSGHYIFGFVRDAFGNPLPGLRVRVYNEFGLDIPPATTKTDPPGWYDVLISEQRARWFVQVVDAGNNVLSPTAEVLNTGNYIEGVEACWHQVDFARVQ